MELTHQLPEWTNPQGSAIPIQYRDILKAGGKTDLEIAAIEDELEGVALMGNLLGLIDPDADAGGHVVAAEAGAREIELFSACPLRFAGAHSKPL